MFAGPINGSQGWRADEPVDLVVSQEYCAGCLRYIAKAECETLLPPFHRRKPPSTPTGS